MRKTLILALLIVAVGAWAQTVGNLRTEMQVNPLGIDVERPRLSWQIVSERRNVYVTTEGSNVMQTGYRIRVASSREMLERGEADLWDSGEVESGESHLVGYEGKPLMKNQAAFWQVKVKTTVGETPWSDIAMWSRGLGEYPMTKSDAVGWQGEWIGHDGLFEGETEGDHSRLAARYLRRTFKTKKAVIRATLHICGLGLYEAYINGECVRNYVNTPSPTAYDSTLIYNTYDVTKHFTPLSLRRGAGGEASLAVILGNGWYYGRAKNIRTFGYPKLLANLIIEYEDGTSETIPTDKRWKLSADGPIRSNNDYDGEVYDARKEASPPTPPHDGRGVISWAMPDFNDKKWRNAEIVAAPTGKLVGNPTPAITATPLTQHPYYRGSGAKYLGNGIYDFGQNLAGWVSIELDGIGNEGDTIRIRYAERLTDDGRTLYTENLRTAQSTDYYICNGHDTGEWHPRFVTHGFRFVEVKNISTPPQPSPQGEGAFKESPFNEKTNPKSPSPCGEDRGGVSAYVICDPMQQTGDFLCNNSMLNTLVENARWGILSNYKGFPTDCPQRDERMPWTGDRTTGCHGEALLMDNALLYAKWLDDIEDMQRADGQLPDVAPQYWKWSGFTDNVSWSAVFITAADMLCRQFGDRQPMQKHLPAMRRWLDHFAEKKMHDGLIDADKYGDWCMPPESLTLIHSKDSTRITEGRLISTAYFYHLARLVDSYSEGEENPFPAAPSQVKTGKRYKALCQQLLANFNRTYLKDSGTPSAHYANNTVTANLLALAFGMVPDEDRKAVENNIVSKIINPQSQIINHKSKIINEASIPCGVIGIQWLMRELSKMGRNDIALSLATQTEYPSWGYMTENGATTIWELWNGNTANPKMNSGNHVMLLGDLLPWCFEEIGGLKPTSPGYKTFTLRPAFTLDCLTRNHIRHATPYGPIESRWEKQGDKIIWQFTIPTNTQAEIRLPNGTRQTYGSGQYTLNL